MWYSVKDAAKQLNKSVRTIQRQATSGKLKSRQVPGVGGSGLVWEIWIEKQEQNISTINEKSNDISTNDKNDPKNVVGLVSACEIKELAPTNDRATTLVEGGRNKVKGIGEKELGLINDKSNDMTKCTGSTTGTCGAGIVKSLENKEDTAIISVEATGSLTGWSRKTVFRKISNATIGALTVPKNGGGHKTTRLPI